MIEKLSPQQLQNIHIPMDMFISQCFPEFSIDVQELFTTQWNQERLNHLADKGYVSVGKNDNTLNSLLVASDLEGGLGTLFWLMVLPSHQKMGIGKQHLKKLIAHYENRGGHKVKLNAPSQKARDYYVAQKFTEEGFHPNHWYNMDFWSLAKLL